MENGTKPWMTEEEASRDLAANEDYLRRMDYLTDEELREQLKATIRRETASLDEWAAAGEYFVLSDAGKVHLPTCPTIQRFMDRDVAWAPYLRHLERVRDWHGSDDNAPDMPRLKTREQIEALDRYATCPLCAPTLDHTDERRNPKGWMVLKAGSLKAKHFGRTFFLPSGEDLGGLSRLTRDETPAGLTFRAEFADGARHVTDPEAMLQYRTPVAGDAAAAPAPALPPWRR
ncbi:hypothetical protein SRABI26_00354 [Arthrobacter sp. Bi26]|uniref:hypothetical protein n=1 Tax=Arthrobacter sp. Bi26 TaxID=2822350 RepID=UPI001D5C7EA1|nr:hypothetical protein [Arthrobacter sp. Bi26]CAH0136286.1 hypothetical protein SRABI26_00354 [Arthrobacter sp. Bi26]